VPGEPTAPIELRVRNISQLFDTLDPFPFPERDLDREAEEFIVSWARELPRGEPLTIRIHLPREDTHSTDALSLPTAFARYFAYRRQALTRDLKELFRVGRLSLLIGIVTLAVCLSLSRILATMYPASGLSHLVAESLVIVGWVANWKPIEIFLYDWWPIARRCRLYGRLAEAKLELEPY